MLDHFMDPVPRHRPSWSIEVWTPSPMSPDKARSALPAPGMMCGGWWHWAVGVDWGCWATIKAANCFFSQRSIPQMSTKLQHISLHIWRVMACLLPGPSKNDSNQGKQRVSLVHYTPDEHNQLMMYIIDVSVGRFSLEDFRSDTRPNLASRAPSIGMYPASFKST